MKFKLALFDVDSTLTETEGIDLLASHSPHLMKVAEITERAMRGELDFDAAIRERVSLLAGLPEEIIDQAIAKTRISRGAQAAIEGLKERGLKIGVVSGGFREIIDQIFAGWPFDLVMAHRIEIENGRLTGKLAGGIINRERKATILREFARASGVELHQCVAVGDGSNDIAMIQLAGLGVSYRGKPVLNQVADKQISDFDELIPLLESL